MYQYDAHDQALVDQRVSEFRDQVSRRLSGALTEDQFKPLRLMNGLYLQLHAYMLRVAIPYGTLSSHQMRVLAHIARRYDRGYGHFTTRQNIQYNWIKLADAPDILADLAAEQMHAIQTSGNCIRNVTSDPWAGVAADEIEDPRIAAEILRQWSTFHPEFSFLPRKFKIAITGAPTDRAAVKVHDIGLRMHRDERGAVGYEVIVGGGLGRTPIIGKTLRPFLPKEHLLSYLEAIMRVYNTHGRRDNMYKARIKILVEALGIDEFRRQVEAEWEPLRDGALRLPPETYAAITERFAPPLYEQRTGSVATLVRDPETDPALARWVQANVAPHKVPGYGIVNISLKGTGQIPGDATASQMELVAKMADLYSLGEIRVTHEQNLVLPHVRLSDLPALWRTLDAGDLATPNVGLISDIIACPGLDYCSLANARSIPLAQALSERFSDMTRAQAIGPLHINISGCINACAHHHVGHIGVLGVDRKGEELYQITLGGRSDEAAALGRIVGPAVPAHQAIEMIAGFVDTYLAIRHPGELFIDTVERLGTAPFKETLHAAA
ncbi:nitrite/sulfite reductase [Roseospira marina]|uniref:Nitrite/sulfite reductase n=1 Tax=Roseospira marina TaxID=140057 RepID=A0A5M6IGK9_9PROT|nr:nitrite/sulfite reductase [Roseospira marina]KAA5607364.1 nitrite/sulfite reductase [Roseospira marina]MBB4312468.1 sulfite reductase (NADPH) hemoprotein beta-component [Roseospira marina]MBB5085516.1 sulfite reductase (NADPH) hemoprotein beta-component [Roseospira marina]